MDGLNLDFLGIRDPTTALSEGMSLLGELWLTLIINAASMPGSRFLEQMLR